MNPADSRAAVPNPHAAVLREWGIDRLLPGVTPSISPVPPERRDTDSFRYLLVIAVETRGAVGKQVKLAAAGIGSPTGQDCDVLGLKDRRGGQRLQEALRDLSGAPATGRDLESLALECNSGALGPGISATVLKVENGAVETLRNVFNRAISMGDTISVLRPPLHVPSEVERLGRLGSNITEQRAATPAPRPPVPRPIRQDLGL